MADPRWRTTISNFKFYCFLLCQSVFFMCIYVVYYIKEMTLAMLLIFYVSKWRNNKKHYKIEYDVAVTSSLGVESQN